MSLYGAEPADVEVVMVMVKERLEVRLDDLHSAMN